MLGKFLHEKALMFIVTLESLQYSYVKLSAHLHGGASFWAYPPAQASMNVISLHPITPKSQQTTSHQSKIPESHLASTIMIAPSSIMNHRSYISYS